MLATKEKEEFDVCPYCGSADIEYLEDENVWYCNYCWQQWDEEGIV